MNKAKDLPTDAEFQIEFGEFIESEFRKAYPYIYPELPPVWYYSRWLDYDAKGYEDAQILDLMQDEIMAQGLADYQE